MRVFHLLQQLLPLLLRRAQALVLSLHSGAFPLQRRQRLVEPNHFLFNLGVGQLLHREGTPIGRISQLLNTKLSLSEADSLLRSPPSWSPEGPALPAGLQAPVKAKHRGQEKVLTRHFFAYMVELDVPAAVLHWPPSGRNISPALLPALPGRLYQPPAFPC